MSEKKYKIATFMLAMILIGIIVGLGVAFYAQSQYVEGYNDATLDIAVQQSNTGNVIYAYIDENNHTQMDLINIQEICRG